MMRMNPEAEAIISWELHYTPQVMIAWTEIIVSLSTPMSGTVYA
jgi:hypothetical protein